MVIKINIIDNVQADMKIDCKPIIMHTCLSINRLGDKL